MKESKLKRFVPVIIFFIVLNGFFISAKNMLQRWHTDQEVLIIGNLLLFVITLISFLISAKGLQNPNPNVFVRSVMGSIMIRMFVCAIAAFIYISVFKSTLNKPALFTCMILYLIYTFLEVSVLMKMLKQKKNA